MRVLPHVERAIDTLRRAVLADSLRDGPDVGSGQRAIERRASMSAGAEAHKLARIVHVGDPIAKLPTQLIDVDEDIGRCGLACERMNGHGVSDCVRLRALAGSIN